MEDFQLTAGQQRGMDLVRILASSTATSALIKGYAGTGKTTLLKEILREFGDAVLLAPTGKAASRITEITGSRGSTAHRWMYKVEEHPVTKEPIFVSKKLEEYVMPASNLVIVDEASMVGPDVYNDLLGLQQNLGFNLLFIGDGFQLPPVQKPDETPFNMLASGFFPEDHVVELTEITRQAMDSPIIRATLAFREGDPLEAMAEIDLVMPEDLDDRLKTGSDMIICWRNEVRHQLNRRVRVLRGYSDFRAGEPLLILKNNKDLDIYNGEVHSFGGWMDELGEHDVSVFLDGQRQIISLHFATAGLNDKEVIFCKEILDGKFDKIGVGSLEKEVSWWMKKRGLAYVHANAGYTLTCHKAQGSEADSVLVCLENGLLRQISSMEGRRWMYTSCTRAKKELALTYL